MRIYFARHGESQANVLHEICNRGLRHGLTRQGRAQAVALAEKLRGQPIARIYSSPLLRAVETSVLLAERLDLDYEVTEALHEYDCGIAEGRSDEAAWFMWQGLADDWLVRRLWERRIPGGESFHDLQERFVPFVEGLVRQYGDSAEGVLCVSHGGLYRMMLPQVLRDFDDSPTSWQGLGYAACLVAELRPEGLTYVERTP